MSFDIVCLSETKTDYVDQNWFTGYTAIPLEKKTKQFPYGGVHGVCVLIKSIYCKYVLPVLGMRSAFVQWVLIKKEAFGQGFIIGGAYFPHEGSRYAQGGMFEDLLLDLSDLNGRYQLPVILLGDFNARTGLVDDNVITESAHVHNFSDQDNDVCESTYMLSSLGINMKRHSQDCLVNGHGYQLIQCLRAADLKIVNGRFGNDAGMGNFTCINANGQSVIDYMIMSPSLLPSITSFEVDVLDKCLSDVHCPLVMHIMFKEETVAPYVKSNGYDNSHEPGYSPVLGKQITQTRWKKEMTAPFMSSFSVNDIQCLIEELEKVMGRIELASLDGVNDFTDKLCEIMLNPARAHDMCKQNAEKHTRNMSRPQKAKMPRKPWFDSVCVSKRKEYLSAKNKLKLANSDVSKAQVMELAKSYKRCIREAKLRYNNELHIKLKQVRHDNPKEYWDILKRPLQNKFSQCTVPLQTSMAHFKNLSYDPGAFLGTQTDPLTLVNSSSICDVINRPFEEDEIATQIRKLKNNKACGIDGIRNEFLKHSPLMFVRCITKLFNVVLDSGIVPTCWTVGLIRPLFKGKGSPDDPDNYRGITLLSCLGKLFTAVVNQRLTLYLEGQGLIGDEQAGFRSGHSTLDHIYVLNSIAELYSSHHKRLYCAFIDYKKAFDLVNRTMLWTKLISNGINGKILRVIHNMYANAKSCVQQGSHVSDVFPCNIGVRQGDNLSPLLFALYLNDFELSISKKFRGLELLSREIKEALSDDDVEYFVRIFCLLYADDTVVLAESPKELQAALDAVHGYCQEWQLQVNITKTKVIIFSRGKVKKVPTFLFGNEPLEVVHEYTYLGTVFSSNGSMKPAVLKQLAQANRALFKVCSMISALNLPIATCCELFDRMVVPVLLYGCEIWGSKYGQYIENFHKKFMKHLLKINKFSANCMAYGELGRMPLNIVIQRRVIGFWMRLRNGNTHKLSYIMMQLQLYKLQNSEFRPRWLSNVKSILDSAGLGNYWSDAPDKDEILTVLETRLADIAKQMWSESVHTNSLCTNYRIFKDTHGLEPYLTLVGTKDRLAMARFRCGNHKLPITESRQKHDATLSTCQLCTGNKPGDEFHYILECSAFRSQREALIPQYYYKHPDTNKFKALFSSVEKRLLHRLSRLIQHITTAFS